MHRNGNCSGFIHYFILTHKAKKQHLFTQTGKSKPNLINLTSHSCRNCLPVPAEEADQPLINAFPRARWIQFFLMLTTKASDPTFHYFFFFLMHPINVLFSIFAPGSSIKMVSPTRNAWSSDLSFTVTQCSLSCLL